MPTNLHNDRVHVCLTAGGAVLLDLRRDRYFGVAVSSIEALSGLLASPGVHFENLESAREVLVDAVAPGRVRITVPDVARFVCAWLSGRWMLKRWSLLRIVQTLEERRARLGQPSIAPDEVRRLLSVFFCLRAFAYSKKGQCLLDTLVLLDFLRRSGTLPTFVIGVKTQPFAAHSWVQAEGYVFNGTPEYVRRFTPILSI